MLGLQRKEVRTGEVVKDHRRKWGGWDWAHTNPGSLKVLGSGIGPCVVGGPSSP